MGEHVDPAEIQVWDLSEKRLLLRKSLRDASRVAYDPFRDVFWVSHEGGFFRVGPDGMESPFTRTPMGGFLRIRPDRDSLALAGREGFVLYDPEQREFSPIFPEPAPLAFDLIDGVLHVAYRQGLRCIAVHRLSLGREEELFTWTAEQVSLSRRPGHAAVLSRQGCRWFRPNQDGPEDLVPDRSVHRVAVSPDGDAAFVALGGRTLLLCGLRDAGPRSSTWIRAYGPFFACTFSSDSRRAVLYIGDDTFEGKLLLLPIDPIK